MRPGGERDASLVCASRLVTGLPSQVFHYIDLESYENRAGKDMGASESPDPLRVVEGGAAVERFIKKCAKYVAKVNGGNANQGDDSSA